MDLYTFGVRLRMVRRARNLTQRELAEKTGLSCAFLTRLEQGERFTSLETLSLLCSALNVTPNDLLGAGLGYQPPENIPERETFHRLGREAMRLVVDARGRRT